MVLDQFAQVVSCGGLWREIGELRSWGFGIGEVGLKPRWRTTAAVEGPDLHCCLHVFSFLLFFEFCSCLVVGCNKKKSVFLQAHHTNGSFMGTWLDLWTLAFWLTLSISTRSRESRTNKSAILESPFFHQLNTCRGVVTAPRNLQKPFGKPENGTGS